ncbi:MAG: ABC transporter permease [Acidobacteria bacterium]|nr:ABC transporter permease [Acidobacteriota bacterium]
MIVLRLGWRNLWRNPRRSLITISAVGCGYAILIVLIGLTVGIAGQMLKNGTGLLMGDLQLHHSGYLPERSLYDTIGSDEDSELEGVLHQLSLYPQLAGRSPRVYGFGLLSTGENSAGARLMGVDPQVESGVSSFLSGLQAGALDDSVERSLLLGDVLARELEATIGSQVAIVTQAADGSLGNDLFLVSGILHTGLSYLDRSLAVLYLEDLQELLALGPDEVHEIAVRIEDPMDADGFAAQLNASEELPANISARSWGELAPQLKDYVSLAQGMYGFIILIIGLFTAMGVLNTMMMAVFERSREIGLVVALGMRPLLIVSSILLESLFLGILGLIGGFGLGAWGMSYLTTQGLDLSRWMGELSMLGTRIDPVLKASWGWDYVLWSALGLLSATLLAALFPAVKAARLNPVQALSAPVEG